MPQKSKDDCAEVFRGFIKRYYHVLHKLPGHRAKFYKDDSSWKFSDGEDKEVNAQGREDIGTAFETCPLNGARVDFGYAHAQMTWNEMFGVDAEGNRTHEGIFILVYGSMELNSEGAGQPPRERLFQQAFMLTRKEREGKSMYYCRNDAFAFVGDVAHAVASSAADDKAAAARAAAPAAPAAPAAAPASTTAAPPPKPAAAEQPKPAAAAPKQAKQEAAPKQEAAKKGATAAKKPKLAAKQGDAAAKKGNSAAKGSGGKPTNSAFNKGNSAANKRGTKQQQEEEPQAPAEKKSWAALAATAPQPGQPRTLVKRASNSAKNLKKSPKSDGQAGGNNKAEGGSSAGNNASKGGRAAGSSGNECSLYVKEIPEKTTEGDVRTQFGKFGKVSEVAINKGYLFVTFTEASAAVAALAAKETIMIGGKGVTIEKRKVDGGQKKGGNGGGGGGGRGGGRSGSRRGAGGRGGRGGSRGGRGRSSGNRGGSSRSRRSGGGGGGGGGGSSSGGSGGNRNKK
jgi:hypothetical protein